MRDVFGIIGAVVASAIGILVIVVAGSLFGIWHTNVFGVAQQNAQTNVIRQTNQYTTTQQTALLSLLNDYTNATDGGQRGYIVGQIWTLSAFLTPEDIPAAVTAFMVTHPRGSK